MRARARRFSMDECEHATEPEHAPHSLVALFDEEGSLQGWSTAFAEDCSRSSRGLHNCRVGDFWPDFDAARWAEIWRRVQGNNVVSLYLARSTIGSDPGQVVELEICRFIGQGAKLAKVEVRRAAGRRLHLLQQEIFESMASGAPFKAIMEMLCRRAEAMAPAVICSVLAVDKEQRLQHVASPSLPEHYSNAIDGLPTGPCAGSCGTAAFRGEPVEVTDIANDPLWADYKHLALPLGLRACWSSPIKASGGRVLGAFAFYFPRPRGPTSLERQIVATCLNLCSVALEHEETRSRAYELAFHDPLTHLANRARFLQRVSDTLVVVAETGQRIAIQYIGLDRFQVVNDTLGHSAGDELLKVVATRLQSVVRDHDTVARIGGDEFALVQVGDLKAEDVADRARQIIELIARPCDADGQRYQVGASVGIAMTPDDGESADELIKHAALAMRRVKELGRGAYFFYEKELNARMQARRQFEADLRAAICAGQFELYYQPVFDMQSSAISGAEALLRWNHPERGIVPPSEFIPVAEECGLIVTLGEWAMKEACLAAAGWPKHVSVAVNLSSVQFEKPGLVDVVADALDNSGLDASRLELEITESVLLHDNAVNVAVLDALSDRGVSIALDDFGTGYSSLSYLQRFSFDRIKIDHTFVRDINRNAGSLKIVRAIVMLAHSLGLAVTAEGVETDEQLAAVRGEGCDEVQGYYTGHPVPLKAFLELLGDDPKQHRVSAA